MPSDYNDLVRYLLGQDGTLDRFRLDRSPSELVDIGFSYKGSNYPTGEAAQVAMAKARNLFDGLGIPAVIPGDAILAPPTEDGFMPGSRAFAGVKIGRGHEHLEIDRDPSMVLKSGSGTIRFLICTPLYGKADRVVQEEDGSYSPVGESRRRDLSSIRFHSEGITPDEQEVIHRSMSLIAKLAMAIRNIPEHERPRLEVCVDNAYHVLWAAHLPQLFNGHLPREEFNAWFDRVNERYEHVVAYCRELCRQMGATEVEVFANEELTPVLELLRPQVSGPEPVREMMDLNEELRRQDNDRLWEVADPVLWHKNWGSLTPGLPTPDSPEWLVSMAHMVTLLRCGLRETAIAIDVPPLMVAKTRAFASLLGEDQFKIVAVNPLPKIFPDRVGARRLNDYVDSAGQVRVRSAHQRGDPESVPFERFRDNNYRV